MALSNLLDKEKLKSLLNEARVITPERDAKLKRLKNKIQDKILNPINPENKKVVIFTAFEAISNV